MILTSNRGFAEWGEVFGDTVVATALLDRLLHHAVVIQIEGSSYRLRQHADLVVPCPLTGCVARTGPARVLVAADACSSSRFSRAAASRDLGRRWHLGRSGSTRHEGHSDHSPQSRPSPLPLISRQHHGAASRRRRSAPRRLNHHRAWSKGHSAVHLAPIDPSSTDGGGRLPCRRAAAGHVLIAIASAPPARPIPGFRASTPKTAYS